MKIKVRIIFIFLLIFFLFPLKQLAAECPKIPDLDLWLNSNQKFAQALQWPFQLNLMRIEPNISSDIFKKPITSLPTITQQQNKNQQVTTPTINPSTLRNLNYLQSYNLKAWKDWPASAKHDLENNFSNYWKWMCQAQVLYKTYESNGFQNKPQGFDDIFKISLDPDPNPLALDPPNNLGTSETGYSSLSAQDAWNLYVKNIAFRLALEAGKFLPWSLNDYNSTHLEIILAGPTMFKKEKQGFELQRALIPTSPLRVYSFLVLNKLLGKTREETFQKILEWERVNLFHAGVTPDIAAEVDYTMMPEVYYQYKGNPPAVKVLQPTQCFYKDKTCSEKRYFSLGCGTTSFLNAYLFETLNIPAETKFIEPSAHMTWCSLGKCASHGDDPYALKSASDIMEPKGPASMLEILISEEQYNSWFNKVNLKAKDYVGRSVLDMELKYLPLRLLRYYCNDGANKDHSESQVYQNFSHLYSIEELESMNLWKKMDEKLKSIGGCDVVPYF